jgi:hypothetical protein
MLRSIPTMFIVVMVAGFSGCTTCSTCLDDDYSHFGGKLERTDQRNGRVNSAFDAAPTINDGGNVVEQSTVSEEIEEIELPMELEFDSTVDPAPAM